MAETMAGSLSELADGAKRIVSVGDAEVLLIRTGDRAVAVQARCPHAGAPLEKGAVRNGRLVCPWHMGTFALPSGDLLEPPPMQPLQTFPVRIEDGRIFVSSTPNPTPQPATPIGGNARTFLLCGTGAAGAMAATCLRQAGFSGRLVAVDPVADEPVDRTQLSKMALSGKSPLSKAPLGTFQQIEAERKHTQLTRLDSAARTATLEDGSTVTFDAALIATGGAPERLEVPGAELAHTLRHTADVEKILAAAEGARNAVVVGTSFIGLEAASALGQKGLSVTVTGPDKLPFEKKLGPEIAEALVAFHRSKGTQFELESEVIRITGDSVTVRSAAGDTRELPADLVILGVGVTPSLHFEHDLPLATEGGGIAVSADLEAAPGVWVAGDIANVEGTRIEHWRLAQQHGMTAARQMLGSAQPFDGVPFFWTFHFGKRLGYLGHAEQWDRIVYEGDVPGLDFLAFYVQGELVEAVLSCGRDHQTAVLAETMREKPTLEQARAALR